MVDLNREEIAALYDKRLSGPEATRPPVTIRPVIDTPFAVPARAVARGYGRQIDRLLSDA